MPQYTHAGRRHTSHSTLLFLCVAIQTPVVVCPLPPLLLLFLLLYACDILIQDSSFGTPVSTQTDI